MQLETYTITGIITVLSSVGFGMMITVWSNRKKTKAETLLAQAQTQFTGIEAYSTMLNDLRAQINMQGDQLKNQAAQILALQKKEDQYMKLIRDSQLREQEYINRIKKLEEKLQQAEELLREYQQTIQSLNNGKINELVPPAQ